MNEPTGDQPPTAASLPVADPSPTESGSGTAQIRESNAPVVGEVMPRPQLSQVADCVSNEVSGLVASDPSALGGVGALRAIASYLNEQSATLAALRRDAEE